MCLQLYCDEVSKTFTLLVTSCAITPNIVNRDTHSISHPSIFKAYGFTKPELAIMNDAADEWCEKTHGKHCAKFIVVTSQPVMAMYGETSAIVIRKDFEQLARSMGAKTYVDDNDNVAMTIKAPVTPAQHTSIIALRVRRAGWLDGGHCSKFYKTVLHELGHAFGREHDPLAGNIMYGGLVGMSCFVTQRDVGLWDEE